MSKFINILIAPDKMKGTLSAKEICEIIKTEAQINEFTDANGNPIKFNCSSLPLADGGDGSLEVLKDILQLQRIPIKVKGPLFEPLESHYSIDRKGNAYIEMANAAGLVQVPAEKRNCMHTTSYGFGQLIGHAISNGIKKVFLFLGGSATCDAGIGMATALGYKFLDKDSKQLQPTGGQLHKVTKIEIPDNLDEIRQTEFVTLHDVNNTILGPQGAAPAFAPQKGANPQEIELLEKGLKTIVNVLNEKRDVIKSLRNSNEEYANLERLKGGGAAGGMGVGTYAFLSALLKPGTEEIMRLTAFSERINNQNCIITAEGQVDTTTLNGKVPFGVCKEANKYNVPCFVLTGLNRLSTDEEKEFNAAGFYSLTETYGLENSIAQPKKTLKSMAKVMLNDISKSL